ncbi:PREDICTED: transcription termination factor 2-like [Branchiostoma belcheri]|uniref:Transcription termination factor 2 n=1 Tax=Branchiostoma belcheri TaxID=7741 RepID=A0A6P4ZD39_BRABE|nr:PREDICTED: transcription termination factor 2-like [Branchiostoma belcheri]
MDVVLCQGHGKPCMLKTGLREGPNKGKSFYICSQMPQSCGFNTPASLPPSGCLKHAGKTIELQKIWRDKENQKWLCYRCQVTKDATKGKGWCGKILYTGAADRRATKTDHVDSKKQWRLVPPETTSDSDSSDSEEYEDAAPYQPSKNPFCKEANKEGQVVASSGKKFDVFDKKVEKENLMQHVDDNKIYDSDKQVDPGRDKSLRGAAVRDDGSKSQRGEGGKTLPAEHNQKSQKGDTEASGKDVKTGKKAGETVKGIGSSKQPQGKEDEVIVLTDNDEDAHVRNTQSANTQVKHGEMQKQPVKAEAVKPKQSVQDGNVTNQPITAGHKKQQPITAFPGFQPASQVMSRGHAALRADLVEQLRKKEDLVKKVQLSVLPDGGKKLMTQIEDLEKAIKSIDLGANQSQPQGASGGHGRQQQPSKHQPQGDRRVLPTHAQPLPAHVLQQMYAPHPQGQTLYGGRMTATRLQQVAGVTSEAIERLHKSLESCPPPDAEVEDPACLRVSLLTHQRQALAWLTWREGQHPSGGILADDMGLGKTLTMISLILTQRQNTGARNKTKVPVPEGVVKSDATLVVCPASLILHWKAEVERHTEDDTLKVYLYHGQNRTKDHTELAEYDLVLSTYELVRKECSSWAADQPTQDQKKGDNQDDTAAPRGPMPVLLRVIWDRIILDEAHAIKNHKSQTSVAACQLRAHSRWAMTGTPIQNDLMDMYPLLRFMRCSPFDEMKVWKKWVDNKTANGKARLNTLVNSLLLRRTKGQEGRDGRPLVSLPQCSRVSHVIELSDDERAVYDKFYQDTRKTFQNYLLQHGEKENVKDRVLPSSVGTVQTVPVGDHNKSAAGQHQNVPGVQQNVKVSHILVQLLRLRQCCCHLSLMKEAVDQETFVNEGIDLTLEQQLREMSLQDNNQVTTPSNTDVTTPSNTDLPSKDSEKSSMFHCDKPSTKIQKVLGILANNKSESTPEKPVKSVIVSQWTKMLDVIGWHLEHAGYKYVVIRGGVPPRQRMEAMEQFNRNPKGPEVLLVSLQAGGVGLNLIGGSHLFLLDMHWNPALEDQASDRIYRVGQKNNVVIHKFVCKDTVEEKIQDLQKAKKNLAQGVLSGGDVGKQKLSLADLRQLFGL